MPMKLPDIILLLTAVSTALMAGFFYSYSISVSTGLGKLTDSEYLRAMQQINRAVLNTYFFACFMGSLLLLPLTTFQHYKSSSTVFILLLLASCCYIFGVFAVTAIVNVPLNNRLEAFQINDSTAAQIREMRDIFEERWNFWNNVRTFAAIGTIVLVLISCITRSK
ncbi:DUF1772 domain-containing protein [Sphingobacterium spiritivorum]|nr:DUF1772 domain-containing protein [Sphingobacterium spiritivorum]